MGGDKRSIDVFAGGGLIWRRDDAGSIELLVVHRPRYNDWSFPKGKRDAGESDLECACREVTEETGFTCEPGVELARCLYQDRRGRSKQVRYWTMTVTGVVARDVTDEVDVIRWVPLPDVLGLLTYERDRPVFDSFCTQVACNTLI